MAKCTRLHIECRKISLYTIYQKKVDATPNMTCARYTYQTNHTALLGLILDAPYLNWKAHIKNLITVCLKKLNMLKAFAPVKWGASRYLLF